MHIPFHMLLIIGWLGIGSILFGQGNSGSKTSLEAGTGTNLSYFDIGGGSPGMSVTGSVLFMVAPSWSLGPQVGFHRARGKDEGTPNENRDYAYKSNIFEFSLKGMYVIRFQSNSYRAWKRKWKPRIYTGIGILQVQPVQNPQLIAGSEEDHLPVAPVFSGGVGIEYVLNQTLSVVIEGGSSLSTSDFLEGYTNLAYSTANDMYHSMMIKLKYFIPAGNY